VPQYLDEVPKNVFTGGRLRYERTGEDYLLYSVGPNREDDRGHTRDSEPPADDVAIRTAAEKP
jgi:hypothetical protein